jgi:pSer/pThr/pTyr-binding forkhead associated (FHA) protein
MSDAVKVAIRVRPYNSRERQEGAVLCVDMESNMVKLTNPADGSAKEFFYDYCYWSHDGFTEDPTTGFLGKSSSSSKYADQLRVYEDLGVEVLNNAWEGFHTCLFAYGQTGSGKSYSMVGYGSNKGIVPVTCEQIFQRMSEGTDSSIKFDVKVSMLEIYNEQVQDLLAPPSSRVKGGLKVREHPKTGVFVEGISKRSVQSYDEINAVTEAGTKNRTVAATQMNATSSRAHTVITISFTQIFYDTATGQPVNRKQSDINLVDLAGSERAEKTGATGDRLAEGSNINKSLSCLGKVITTLAKKSAGTLGKGEVVPYRESKLTRILQNALGGNSKTTMIAAISPATFNYDETLSTLRYADAVKAIKNKAIVNETPQEKLIRELREENEKLKELIGGGVKGGSSGMSDEMRQEYEAQIEELRRQKEEAEKTMQEKLSEASRHTVVEVERELSVPHLSNLNEDPQLTGYIKHALKEGQNRLGRVAGENDIVLQGLGVGNQHCILQKNGSRVTLQPSQDPSLKTYLNGQVQSAPAQINPQDRIRFGGHLYFAYVDPAISGKAEVGWEDAVKEASEIEMNGIMQAKEEEMRRKMQEEMQAAHVKFEEERKRMTEELTKRDHASEESKRALAEREAALEAKQKQVEEDLKRKAEMLRKQEQERQTRSQLDQELGKAMQLVNEANERAATLGKRIRFKPEFYKQPKPGGGETTSIRLRVILPELGDDRVYWSLDQLQERLPDMSELCQQFFDGTPLAKLDFSNDPFKLDMEDVSRQFNAHQLIGQVFLYTQTLFYCMEIYNEPQPIYDTAGEQQGSLYVGIVPELEGDVIDDHDSLEEVEGVRLKLKVLIDKAVGLPRIMSDSVYCAYTLQQEGNQVHKTGEVTGTDPEFNSTKHHSFIVTRRNSQEISEGSINISVYGKLTHSSKSQQLMRVQTMLGTEAPSHPEEHKAQPEAKKPAVEDKKPPPNPPVTTGKVAPSTTPPPHYSAKPAPESKAVIDNKPPEPVVAVSATTVAHEAAHEAPSDPKKKSAGCCLLQ